MLKFKKSSDSCNLKFIPILTVLLSTTFAAIATEETSKGLYGGMRAGTLGIHGEAGYIVHPSFGFRLQGGGFSHKRETFNFNGTSYRDVEIKPLTFNLIADWYLLNNGIKISIGGGYNRSRLGLKRDMTNTNIKFQGITIPGSNIGVISANFNFKKFAPYVGIGYDSNNLFGSRFSLSVDIGAYLQGNCRANVSATGAIQNNTVIMGLLKDELQKVIDSPWWVKKYPVVSIALRYQL